MSKRHPVLTAFGLNVRKQREARGLTQEALAEKADLDQTYISGIERGIRNPSILSIAKIAKALGVSLSQLTNGIRG
jgi:transcriptional regulator with XRE-family HTH domain